MVTPRLTPQKHRLGEIYTVSNDEKIKAEKNNPKICMTSRTHDYVRYKGPGPGLGVLFFRSSDVDVTKKNTQKLQPRAR
jgi:hypothetical protein